MNSILYRIGDTPLIRTDRFSRSVGSKADIWVKYEGANPSGSLKDRVMLRIVNEAVKSGRVRSDTPIAISTAGNGGVSLSMVCAAMGIRAAVIAPDDIAPERAALIRGYGAELITVPSSGRAVHVKQAEDRINEKYPDVFWINPFEDEQACVAMRACGEEIAEELDDIDVFIAGVGTGASLTGCAEVIKGRFRECRVVAVEPVDSPVLSGGYPGVNSIPGLGAGFVPKILNYYIIDEVMRARTPESFDMCRRMAAVEGISCGLSSGAVLQCAARIAVREEYEGKTIVALLPDNAGTYFSLGLYK